MAISRNKRRRIQARATLRNIAAPMQGLPHEARPMREAVERREYTPKGLVSSFYQWAEDSVVLRGRGLSYKLPDYMVSA